ncbi:hypothetical protein FOTG_12508 [Fusarium oxysporum f. sp. vasinfectum 25433]|uniref:Uncharacterized protein n=1 Tax=Fusarium oxysporum f. sp. vasinfectum 25433 TaxID=1089449 RepID=X0LEC0_FUSOX|nr:hypothetical protein FOTG_12508 [Fusarium oxysporum f. sp. vasinfectum 25433]
MFSSTTSAQHTRTNSPTQKLCHTQTLCAWRRRVFKMLSALRVIGRITYVMRRRRISLAWATSQELVFTRFKIVLTFRRKKLVASAMLTVLPS